MIEREVTDLISITSSIFCLSLIIFSANAKFEDNMLIIVGLVSISLINFLHIIFVQLDMSNKAISGGFSGASSVALIFAIIGKFNYTNEEWDGFWNKLHLEYNHMFFIGFFVLIVFALLSFIAEPLKIEVSSSSV